MGYNFSNQQIGVGENLSYSNEYFDFIFLGEVLEHSWQPKKLVDECFRVLKKGGNLILDTPNIYALPRIIRYLIKGRDIILGDPDHKIFYSRAMLENLIQQAGFEIKQITSDTICTIKGKNIKIPNFGPFKFLGDHLMIAAQKK